MKMSIAIPLKYLNDILVHFQPVWLFSLMKRKENEQKSIIIHSVCNQLCNHSNSNTPKFTYIHRFF